MEGVMADESRFQAIGFNLAVYQISCPITCNKDQKTRLYCSRSPDMVEAFGSGSSIIQ
jgi:hypothetical protein